MLKLSCFKHQEKKEIVKEKLNTHDFDKVLKTTKCKT